MKTSCFHPGHFLRYQIRAGSGKTGFLIFFPGNVFLCSAIPFALSLSMSYIVFVAFLLYKFPP